MKNLYLSVPSCWSDVDGRSLRIIARILFDFGNSTTEEILSRIALRLSGIRILGSPRPGYFSVRFESQRFVLSLDQLMSIYDRVRFVLSPPFDLPPPALLGVQLDFDLFICRRFDEWMNCENEYQAFLFDCEENRFGHLRALAISLYRLPVSLHKRLTAVDTYICFFVWQSFKALLANIYPHLFSTAGEDDESPNLAKMFAALIRALSGGDITKRDAILSSPIAYALSELDAKAEEIEILDKKSRRYEA